MKATTSRTWYTARAIDSINGLNCDRFISENEDEAIKYAKQDELQKQEGVHLIVYETKLKSIWNSMTDRESSNG